MSCSFVLQPNYGSNINDLQTISTWQLWMGLDEPKTVKVSIFLSLYYSYI